MNETFRGVVRWFNAVKGYGFIGRETQTSAWPKQLDDKDVFVHFTAINDSGYKKLEEGNIVEFSVEEGQAGRLQAIQVVNITNAAKSK